MLTPWKKSYYNLDSIFKSRDITLPTKVCLVKAMVFPVAMYGCESWAVKKAERREIDAFELCCWRRLLRVPWTERISNQSILKEISLGCSLEGMMLKLKLQYLATSCEELSHWKRLWYWEGLGAGGEGDARGWVGWWHHRLHGREFEWTPGVGNGQGGLACCNSWGRRVRHDWATELNWINCLFNCKSLLESLEGALLPKTTQSSENNIVTFSEILKKKSNIFSFIFKHQHDILVSFSFILCLLTLLLELEYVGLCHDCQNKGFKGQVSPDIGVFGEEELGLFEEAFGSGSTC